LNKANHRIDLLDELKAACDTLGMSVLSLREKMTESTLEYDKKVAALRANMANLQENLISRVIQVPPGKYEQIPKGGKMHYKTWRALMFGKRPGRAKRMGYGVPLHGPTIAAWATITAVAALSERPEQDTMDALIADAKQLVDLLYLPFSKDPIWPMYQYIEHWSATAMKLYELSFASEAKLAAVTRLYRVRLTEISRIASTLGQSLQSKRILRKTKVAEVEELIKEFNENWEFDRVEPMNIGRDHFGVIKVGVPDLRTWYDDTLQVLGNAGPAEA
jgi:hypothetical protein